MMRFRVFANSEDALRARIVELEAQVAGLEAMNTEKAAEIRRLRMGNHPAGKKLKLASTKGLAVGNIVAVRKARRAVLDDQPDALREALTERDAEHEGGDGA